MNTQERFQKHLEGICDEYSVEMTTDKRYANVGTWRIWASDAGWDPELEIEFSFQDGYATFKGAIERPYVKVTEFGDILARISKMIEGEVTVTVVPPVRIDKERNVVSVTLPYRTVSLEAWPEHGAWYEVGRTSPGAGGQVGSLYAPMMADGSLPTPYDVGELRVPYEQA